MKHATVQSNKLPSLRKRVLIERLSHIRLCLLAVALLSGCLTKAQTTIIFGITNQWRYNQTDNLDGVNWYAPGFNDASWPSGPGLLYCDDNPAVAPRNTLLTLGANTYYFRAHFQYSPSPNMVLTFSNKIDAGAVFYLNGREIERIRLSTPPAIIYYSTGAPSQPPSGDATEWDVFSVPATNALSGDNVLAVEVHQFYPPDNNVVFGSALSVGPISVCRGPYLQSATPTSIVIRWRTDLPTNSFVWFGTNSASLLWQPDPTITSDHTVTLSSLTPDTKYFYAVGTSKGVLAGGDTNFFFVTPPLPGTPKPARVWIIGDSGTADSDARAVRDAYFNYTGNRHTDLWLMLGDNAYLYGADFEYQAAVFDMYRDLLRNSPLWPTLGNHDTAQSTSFVDTYPYFSIFTLPTNGAAGGTPSGTAHYYSFDFGNIHFVCLDSMTANRATNGPMAAWLRADLDATTQPWRIAFWHHPPYSDGGHNSDTETELIEMRQNIVPILEQGGIDLVFCGHSHAYERSFFLDGHYGSSATLTTNMILNPGSGGVSDPAGPCTKWALGSKAHQGAVYVVAGCAGHTTWGPLAYPAMFYSHQALGSVVLDINDDSLSATFLRDTGAIEDQFTIVKRDARFVSAQAVSGALQLSLTNVASKKTNLIQASSSFSNWIPLSTNVTTSNQFRFNTPLITNPPWRFYRLQRLP